MLEIFEYARELAMKEGEEMGMLKDAREMVMEALTERFVAVPADIREKVHSFGQHDLLKQLLRHAIRSSDIKEFRAVLSKILAVS